jgi:hypothetical protein
MYITNFIKIGSGIQKLVHTRFHKDRFRYSKVEKGDLQTEWCYHKRISISLK